jgi:hypothetical protein
VTGSLKCAACAAGIPPDPRLTLARLKRLKQPNVRGVQLRMFAASEMPTELLAPLEKDIVERTRRVLGKLGYKTWSGRAAIFDPSPEARAERVARGWPLFLPVLDVGCPDILGVMPDCKGRLFGLEFKRDLSEKERASQLAWREMAGYWGILCQTVRSVDEAVTFLESHRTRK